MSCPSWSNQNLLIEQLVNTLDKLCKEKNHPHIYIYQLQAMLLISKKVIEFKFYIHTLMLQELNSRSNFKLVFHWIMLYFFMNSSQSTSTYKDKTKNYIQFFRHCCIRQTLGQWCCTETLLKLNICSHCFWGQ